MACVFVRMSAYLNESQSIQYRSSATNTFKAIAIGRWPGEPTEGEEFGFVSNRR
jgi:hypothetical protein